MVHWTISKNSLDSKLVYSRNPPSSPCLQFESRLNSFISFYISYAWRLKSIHYGDGFYGIRSWDQNVSAHRVSDKFVKVACQKRA